MRWNRDYSVKGTWTYELNKDLYDCYVEADRSVYGYSRHMKTLWDARHPEYSHMTAKHLTTQISGIQKKKLILESTQNSTQTETERTIVSQKDNSGTNHQKETENISQAVNATGNPQVQLNVTKEQENKFEDGERSAANNESLDELVNEIRPEWQKNYNKYLNTTIENREFTTKKDRRIEEIEILAINKIIEESLENDERIDLWKINVMQYTTAVTLLARHGKLHERRNNQGKRKTTGWILNYENRVNAIRRKLAHVQVILNCKDNVKLMKKQYVIKEKLRNLYGSTKRAKMLEVQANLKHELKVQARILYDKKLIAERQRINTLFNTNAKLVY